MRGMEGTRSDGSGGAKKGFTKEFILAVSGCYEGGQCGDLSPVGGVHRWPLYSPASLSSPGSMQAIHECVFILVMLRRDALLSTAILWSLRGRRREKGRAMEAFDYFTHTYSR